MSLEVYLLFFSASCAVSSSFIKGFRSPPPSICVTQNVLYVLTYPSSPPVLLPWSYSTSRKRPFRLIFSPADSFLLSQRCFSMARRANTSRYRSAPFPLLEIFCPLSLGNLHLPLVSPLSAADFLFPSSF